MDLAAQLKKAVLPHDVDTLDNLDPWLIGTWGPLLHRVLRRYFRGTVRGMEHVPSGAAMIVGNHNAGITFFEPFLFGLEYYRVRGMDDPLYFLGHDAVVNFPGLGQLLTRTGAIRASHANGRKILDAGRKLVVFPGGNHEAFRPWSERHRVDFGGHSGFAALALEKNAPIVPMLSIGGHDTFFILNRGERLARITRFDKLLRSKSFPISLALPWGVAVGPVFHFPLPAKLEVVLGEPIVPSEAVGMLPREEQVPALYRLVVDRLQTMMNEAAARRSPLRMGSKLRTTRAEPKA